MTEDKAVEERKKKVEELKRLTEKFLASRTIKESGKLVTKIERAAEALESEEKDSAG